MGLIIGDGDGSLRSELREEAGRLGLSDAVHFTGYVPEVADAYRALSVLVSCSRFEGLPLNLIEAMALSVPVLSMATGGCADIVLPERTGLLVPRGDKGALGAGLLRLCRDPALRERLGAAGLSRARERYSLNAWAEGAERVYQGIRRPPPGPGSSAALPCFLPAPSPASLSAPPAQVFAQKAELFGEVRLGAVGIAASTYLLGPDPGTLNAPCGPPVPRTDIGGAVTATGVALFTGSHYRYRSACPPATTSSCAPRP